MSLRAEDIPLIKMLEDALVAELDRQHLNGEIEPDSTGSEHFDAVDGELAGRPDWFKVARAVAEALWAEEGR
ncbi:hypothetical protein SEA_SLIMJIMMY_80 [Mycobacterium phage SlimJimmy]|uniref:Uncharacterized protein n=1 Tax=Mycobacterium phage Bricole TaxID=1718601 RepID=A0A0M5M0T3_9CAUD|nr:hypothetical protein SEA_BRICOLE_80 [Mycobacterium phage Bricole]WMI33259.1 hypothetical protein SEA_SLIMJIMMY_80 [Mycobacterium phage SlimJimmy]WNN95662.1 hypothetical protein SEA_GLASKE16_82 [Mycobacterium phage Glaske16]